MKNELSFNLFEQESSQNSARNGGATFLDGGPILPNDFLLEEYPETPAPIDFQQSACGRGSTPDGSTRQWEIAAELLVRLASRAASSSSISTAGIEGVIRRPDK